MGDQNTILLTIDSLRADFCEYVSPDGENLTPTITRLADDGIAYTQAMAPGPRTPSSVPTLSTGVFHQYRDGRPNRDWQYRHHRIGEFMRRHRTIAEQMRDQGYNTAAVTMNPWTTSDTSFDSGFDEFLDLEAAEGGLFAGRPAVASVDRLLEATGLADRTYWSSQKYWFIHWKSIFPLIRDMLDQLSSPYFLWVFLLDCHLPYISPRAYRSAQSPLDAASHLSTYVRRKLTDYELSENDGESFNRAYRDAVRSTDAFVEKLLATTAERGDDPVVVLHADHGEGLGDHGTFSHQRQLYEENLRVPFVVHNADSRATVEDQVSLRSLPTVLRQVSNDETSFDPASITADWTLSQTEFGDRTALRGGGFKYIRNEDSEELYDLQTDPDERRSLATERPKMLEELRRLTDHRLAGQRERRAHYDAVQALNRV